jgi:DNA-binding XRE family transcriptional regulator
LVDFSTLLNDLMSPRSLKQLRVRLKLTQAAAAALVRVSPNTWARWERGEAKPRGALQQEGIANLARRNHSSQAPVGWQVDQHSVHSTAGSLLKFAGTWVGDDLEERLAEVHAWRGRAVF